MRVIIRTSIVVALAALTIFSANFSAQANPWHAHGGYHGYWGPGLVFGLAGAAILAGAAANNCYVEQPMYDRYGNFVGYRTINTCY